mgnify:CR=1 FL=1
MTATSSANGLREHDARPWLPIETQPANRPGRTKSKPSRSKASAVVAMPTKAIAGYVAFFSKPRLLPASGGRHRPGRGADKGGRPGPYDTLRPIPDEVAPTSIRPIVRKFLRITQQIAPNHPRPDRGRAFVPELAPDRPIHPLEGCVPSIDRHAVLWDAVQEGANTVF